MPKISQFGIPLLLSFVSLEIILLLTRHIHTNKHHPISVTDTCLLRSTPLIKPAEFKPMKTIFLGIPNTHTCDHVSPLYSALTGLIRSAIRQNVEPIITARKQIIKHCSESFFNDLHSLSNRIQWREYSLDSIWVRDFGPGFIYNQSSGSYLLLRPIYEGIHEESYSLRLNDAFFVNKIAQDMNLQIHDIDLSFEWGNILTNGCGICIASDTVVYRNAMRLLGMKKFSQDLYMKMMEDVEKKFKEYAKTWFGCDLKIVKSLSDVGTMHVDMYMFFLDENNLVVGLYEEDEDPINHEIMKTNIEYLRNSIPEIQITTIPMPTNCPTEMILMEHTKCPDIPHDHVVFRTYANVVLINKEILVPTYSALQHIPQEQEKYRKLVKTLLELMKKIGYERTIIPIPETDGLADMQGNIHCITQSLHTLNSLE